MFILLYLTDEAGPEFEGAFDSFAHAVEAKEDNAGVSWNQLSRHGALDFMKEAGRTPKNIWQSENLYQLIVEV